MRRPIYLDYMATTPVDDRVLQKMMGCMGTKGCYGNPASTTHIYGREAEELVLQARTEVANTIGADEREIIWTSGATESNNLALKGAALFYRRKGNHIITTKIEHKSVLDSVNYLAENGFDISFLNPDKDGLIHPLQIKEAIRQDTILLSVMHVNNEIGVIQNIKQMAEIAKSKGVIFHVDAAQSLGKLPIDVNEIKADLMSFSAHKLYGPKGIGALYVRRKPRVRLQPLIHGGGHELGLRSGTLATHQIVGMGESCRIAKEVMHEEGHRIGRLRDKLLKGIQSLENVYVNGSRDHVIPGNLNVSFDFVEGESLLLALRGLAVSTGSACNSATIEPSHVLRAIGCSNELANSTIRFSIGRFTTEEEINEAISEIKKVVIKLREISPLGKR